MTERGFLNSGFEFVTDYVILAGIGRFVMNFALTIPEIAVIRPPNGRNIRHQFKPDPVELLISGSLYYVFSTFSGRDVTAGTWLLQA